MSFQALPPEVFQQIADYSSYGPERDCLRITCRQFRSYLPRPYIQRARPGSNRDLWRAVNFSLRLEFVSRLFRPGNVFDQQQRQQQDQRHMTFCGRCCTVRPTTKFPLGMLRNGYQTCEDCIITVMGEEMDSGCVMVYKGINYRSCESCNEILRDDELNYHNILQSAHARNAVHYTSIGGPEGNYLCLECHYDNCGNMNCSGWSVECILDYPWNFCLNGDYHACFECNNCKKIGEIVSSMIRTRRSREYHTVDR